MAEKKHKQNASETDSSFKGESEFICIGKIHRTHGIHGAVVFNPMTDFPERIRVGRQVFVGEEHQPLTVLSVRTKPPYLLLQFKEASTDTEAAPFGSRFLFVRRDSLPKLPEGEYYFHQLIGLRVVDPAGNLIGTLREILETGANDVYLIEKPDGGEELAAAIPEVVLSVDLNQGTMTVNLPEWY